MFRHPQATLLALGLALAAVAGGQDIRVDLELGPGDSIGLDELAVLNIRVDGADDSRVRPEADFELENFRIISGPSTANKLLFQDGAASRSLTLTWHLQPLALGTARVYSASLRYGIRDVDLPEDQLEVRESSLAEAQARAPAPETDVPEDASPGDAFESFSTRRNRRPRSVEPPKIYLSAAVEPRDPYVGEQVLYTLYLFTQADVRSVNPEELPDFKGFWSRTVPQPDQLRPAMIYRDGDRIGKVVLLQRALFPRRAGRVEIEPVTARLAALMPDTSSIGSLLPRTREILRSSDAVTVDVRALPPPPDGFQGAVGQLELEVELSPIEIEVGDAATLALTLEGRGHFRGLPPPRLGEMAGIRAFPPQQQSNEAVESKKVSGERTWSFVLVPERPGTWQLPPIEVPYFDPAQERYLTASATVPALVVKGSSRLLQRDGQTVELHPIRTTALPEPDGSGWGAARPWLFGLPWALATVVLLVRRGRRGPDHHPRRQRLLDRLRDAAGLQPSRQAAAEIEEAWREFLHDRWALPLGSPSTQWGTLLAARGARRQAADELVKLADDLHYLRYAPKLSSTEELQRDLVERSRKLVRVIG